MSNLLTEGETGYVAGLIDGEGSISLHFQKSRKGKLGYGIRPSISISNNDLSLLSWLKEKLGTYYIEDIRKSRLNNFSYNKPCYSVRIHEIDKVISILTKILPYLRVKRKQAEIVLQYCQLRKTRWMLPYSRGEFTLLNQIRELNHRNLVDLNQLFGEGVTKNGI